MLTIQELFGLVGFCAAMTFSPGPNTTLSTALSVNHGMQVAMRFVLAVPVGWLVLMLACSAGLGALIVAHPVLRLLIKGVGIAYLLWLAWNLLNIRHLPQGPGASVPQIGFWQGVSLQFVNIKAWMLAITVIAAWGIPEDQAVTLQTEILRLLMLSAVMVFFAFFSNLTYAWIGSHLREWLAEEERLLWFNRLLALVLVFTAYWMIEI